MTKYSEHFSPLRDIIYYERRFHNLETITYTVDEGNTLWGIANFFGTTTEELIKLNNLQNPETIYPGTVLKIPVDTPRAPKYYAVRPGDTLFEIARRYNLDVKEILKMNPLGNKNLIFPGQILKLRADA